MRGATRRIGIALTLLVAVCAATALVVLRSGRPLYYTDGAELVRADALAERPMAVWGRPIPEVELPGPVRGRVAILDDGRLIYGRAAGDARTTLVVFDPRSPDVEPVPLSGVDHPGHDLSPALDAEGNLLFASDRDGGEGGFDLWRATRVGPARFGPPLPLPPGINTPGDELDPAPAPFGGALAFARRAPDGRGARIWLVDRDADPDAEPRQVSQEPIDAREQLVPVIEREPAFAPDGSVLWFVAERYGHPKAVLSVVRHRAELARPVADPALSEGGGFRAPAPTGDAMFVLRDDGDSALWCRAPLRLVQPWWAGQLALERALWIALVVSLVLLVLLLLGRRWRALDIVTWCILASLLIHFLLWFLLEGLPLVLRDVDAPPGPDRLELRMVASADAAASESGGGGDRAAIAARAERPSRNSDLAAATPATALADAVAAATPPPPAAARSDALPEPASMPAVAAELADAPESFAASAARDAALSSAIPAPAAAGVAEAVAPATERTQHAAAPLIAAAPSTGALSEAPATTRAPAAFARPEPAFERAEIGAPRVAVADAPATAAPATTERATLDVLATAPVAAPSARAARAPAVERAASPAASSPIAADPAPDSALGAPDAVLRTPPSAPRRVETPLLASSSPRPPTALRDTPPAVATPVEAAAGDARPVAVASAALPAAAARAAEPLPAPTRSSTGRLPLPSARPDTSASVLRRPGGTLPRPTGRPALRDLPESGGEPAAHAAPEDAVAAAAPKPAGAESIGSAIGAPVAATARAVEVEGPQRTATAFVARVDAPESFLPRAPRRLVMGSPPELRTEPLDLYGNRFGPRKDDAIERYGGSAQTEAAVAHGLAYLASVQDRRGHWGRRGRDHSKYGETWVGKTGLALLAFLGAGHLPGGPTEHAQVAANAVDALLKSQHDATGHFGATSAYSHGIATYALAECYALTKDARLRVPLERAVAWIARNQDRGRDQRNRGGWGYYSPFLRPEDGYARTSVTAWQLMALESAKLSGVPVDHEVLDGARAFLRQMFDERRGYFLYNKEPSRLRSSWRTLPASTPAATFCLLLLGESPDEAHIRAGLAYTLERRPTEWRRSSDDRFVLRGEGNPYFWYYGTLTSFLAGGEAWRRWNEALKASLLPAQNQDGSFTPIGAYASYADDRPGDYSYTTSLAVLSLEVYYRYFTPLLAGR